MTGGRTASPLGFITSRVTPADDPFAACEGLLAASFSGVDLLTCRFIRCPPSKLAPADQSAGHAAWRKPGLKVRDSLGSFCRSIQ